MRLDKFLAHCNLGSRKEVKQMIRKGRVQVNDNIVKNDDYQILEGYDQVSVDGEVIDYIKDVYLMMNKPANVVSATYDHFDETVIDLIDPRFQKDCFPIGRLDKDTEGLLIISNDGNLAHKLLSPKNHIEKTYYVEHKEPISSQDAITLCNGSIIIDDKAVMEAKYEKIDDYHCFLTIMEGRFHQVKRMFHAIHNEVLFLKRISMGPIVLDENLELGEVRFLSEEEIKLLKSL